MRLGDVVLLLPALGRLKAAYPAARLTLLTDERCAPLAGMCPYVDEVITVDRLTMRDGPILGTLSAMARLVADIRRRRFDLVIDFLSFRETNLLARLSGARYRLGMKRYRKAYLSWCFNLPPVLEDKQLHVAEMFRLVAAAAAQDRKAEAVLCDAPLVIPEAERAWAAEAVPGGKIVTLYVGAPVAVRRWPAAHFARVADFVIEKFGASVAVLAGLPESESARQVARLCAAQDRISVFTDVSIPQLAALIARSHVLVSNDTGPMHIGPAVGVPTLGLFSVGYPEHFRPTGERSRFLRANPIENISPASVMREIEEMWSA